MIPISKDMCQILGRHWVGLLIDQDLERIHLKSISQKEQLNTGENKDIFFTLRGKETCSD